VGVLYLPSFVFVNETGSYGTDVGAGADEEEDDEEEGLEVEEG
jgi:hypothetical protein